jgi:hypothetical protein
MWGGSRDPGQRRIEDRVPQTRRLGARNAYLALRQAAAEASDFDAARGYTLERLSRVALVSERRLRDSLKDLALIGLVERRAKLDDWGRSEPTLYALVEGAKGTTKRPTRTKRPGGTKRPARTPRGQMA